MENFNFYSPTEFVFGKARENEIGAQKEDIPTLVEKLGIGDGTMGGFKKLNKDDVTAIYELAAR